MLAFLPAAIPALLAPANAAKSPSRPASPSRVFGVGAHAAVVTGYALAVDKAAALPVVDGCTSVPTGTDATLAAVAVSAVGGAQSSTVSVGAGSWTVAPGQHVTAVQWVPVQSGAFPACVSVANLATVSLKLLAHTVLPDAQALPGGLIDLSARIPLSTTGTRTGKWAMPADTVPANAAGLILQVSSPRTGLTQVTSGASTIQVAVGAKVSAQTVVIPMGTLSWTSTSGVAPTALLLGFVTSTSDVLAGGSLLNVLPSPVSVTGSAAPLAGVSTIPSLGAQIPATGILANVQGSNPSVEDSLGGGRQTPTAAIASNPPQSLLRLADDGAVHLTTSATLNVVAWLGGDVIYGPTTDDLTQPGAPQPTGMPSDGALTFAGQPSFRVGDTLILGASDLAPGGLIAIVDSLSSAAGVTTVAFHHGGLLDAFNNLNIVTQVPAAASTTSLMTASAKPRAAATTIGTSVSLGFGATKSLTLGSNPSVTGKVGFGFAPQLTVSISVNWGLSPNATLRYALDTTTTVNASLTAQASWSGNANVSLGTFTLGAFDLGPVVVVPKLDSSLSLNATVQGSATVAASFSQHTHDGFTMTGGFGHVSNQGDSSNGIGAPKLVGSGPEVSIQASADARLSFTFTLAIYGAAGPDATASADLGVSIDPLRTGVASHRGCRLLHRVGSQCTAPGTSHSAAQYLGHPDTPGLDTWPRVVRGCPRRHTQRSGQRRQRDADGRRRQLRRRRQRLG